MSQRETTKHDIQRDELNSNRVGFSVVSRIHVSGSVSMAYTGIDAGTGEVTILVTGSAGGTANPPITGSVVIQDEGVTKGSALTLNFVGENVDASVSGSVARVFVTGSASGDVGGWISDSNTWAFLSADAPSYVVSVNANITGSIGVGMKSQFSHLGSTKNFIVTAVSITGSTSYLNLYGGTDYTLTTGAITTPKYSYEKAPFGFPVSPVKWTVSFTDSTERSQASPATGTWYNIGSLGTNIPIGVWNVRFKRATFVNRGDSGQLGIYTSLSSSSSSETNPSFTDSIQGNVSAAGGVSGFGDTHDTVTLTAKTTFYPIALTDKTGISTLYFENQVAAMIVDAVCGYL